MKKTKKLLIAFSAFILFAVLLALTVNFSVIFSQKDRIKLPDDFNAGTERTDILVLGCGVADGRPSDMLADRLLTALEVSKNIPDSRLILSGNNAGEQYNEVGVMESFVIEHGFPKERIVLDDYGFSTGESITNLHEKFSVKKVIIVTQKYHLYRALHIASRYGIEAYGVASNCHSYTMQPYYSLREVAARNKDFFKYLFKA